jgi:hypothetical protein
MDGWMDGCCATSGANMIADFLPSSSRVSIHRHSNIFLVSSFRNVFFVFLLLTVKSLRAVSMSEAALDEKGFVGDRPAPLPAWKKDHQFGPNDSTHRFLTQRQCPSLATVGATLDHSNHHLTLEYKKKRIQIPLRLLQPPQSPKQQSCYRAGIWNDQVVVDDMGDEAATFLQQIVNADGDAKAAGSLYQNNIRLVSHSQADRRSRYP